MEGGREERRKERGEEMKMNWREEDEEVEVWERIDQEADEVMFGIAGGNNRSSSSRRRKKMRERNKEMSMCMKGWEGWPENEGALEKPKQKQIHHHQTQEKKRKFPVYTFIFSSIFSRFFVTLPADSLLHEGMSLFHTFYDILRVPLSYILDYATSPFTFPIACSYEASKSL